MLAFCVTLAASGSALARTKTCAHINGCSTVLVAPPALGGAITNPPPASRFGLTVRTAPTSTAGSTNRSGKLVGNLLLRRIGCPGYKLRAPDALAFQLLTATPTRIDYVVSERLTNTTDTGIQFCLAAPFGFKTLSGARARVTKLPDGTRGHVGLLPRCANPKLPPGLTSAPCVVGVTTVSDPNSTTGVDVIVRARVPTTTKADPWGGS